MRETLRAMMPLHARPDDYVFINELTGGPIDQGEWAREFWHRPLRALNIRTRKFYATHHTFISISLTAGLGFSEVLQGTLRALNGVGFVQHQVCPGATPGTAER